ncbi:MAG: hypothetical protein H7839_05185 [Magnetococcus sp. YQC-5]
MVSASQTVLNNHDTIPLRYDTPVKTQTYRTGSLSIVKEETPRLTQTPEGHSSSDWSLSKGHLLTVISRDPLTQSDDHAHGSASQVKATVHSVDADQVRLSCEFPNGQIMMIRVPSIIVPKESLRYGAPVTVSKSTEGGYLRLLITPRQIRSSVNLTQEFDELEQWAHS